jgi:hypothetical protein
MSEQPGSVPPAGDVKEQLKANLLQKLVENAGTAFSGPPPPPDRLMAAPRVANVVARRAVPQKPAARYVKFQAFRKTPQGKTVVWSAEDTKNGNAPVYAVGVFKPEQDAAWLDTPPPDDSDHRVVAIEKAPVVGLEWGKPGACWWRGIDTKAASWPTLVYAETAEASTLPHDQTPWVDASTYQLRIEQLAKELLSRGGGQWETEKATANAPRELTREDHLKDVDSALSVLLGQAASDAISKAETNMAYPNQVDPRWYLPPREKVQAWLAEELEKLAAS